LLDSLLQELSVVNHPRYRVDVIEIQWGNQKRKTKKE